MLTRPAVSHPEDAQRLLDAMLEEEKELQAELAKRQITVNCVAPGLIESDMTDELPLEQMLEAIPLRRIGQAEEVAALVAFLCSPDAGYITRQVISINGAMA